MARSTPSLADLLQDDPRYPYEAYVFVFEALGYAHHVLGLGEPAESEPLDAGQPERVPKAPQRHVTGQQLCEAVRRFALEQYGYMAKTVLATWGIHSTGDIGAIVFNLVKIEKMSKTPHDSPEDFENVYDFDEAFRRGFQIHPPD